MHRIIMRKNKLKQTSACNTSFNIGEIVKGDINVLQGDLTISKLTAYSCQIFVLLTNVLHVARGQSVIQNSLNA